MMEIEVVSYLIWGIGWANAAPMFLNSWLRAGEELHGSKRRFVFVSFRDNLTFKWFWQGLFNILVFDRILVWEHLRHLAFFQWAECKYAYYLSDTEHHKATGLYGNIGANAFLTAFTAFFWVGLNQEWIGHVYNLNFGWFMLPVHTNIVASCTGTMSGWMSFGHIDNTYGYRRYAFFLRLATVIAISLSFFG